MFYFRVKEYESDYTSSRVYSSEVRIEKNGYVVIPDNYNKPITAQIACAVQEYEALASTYDVEPIICIIDLKAYNKMIFDKNKKAMLVKKMQDKLSEVKLLETLKKYAEKDEDMRALMKEYQSNSEEETNDYEY